MGDAEGGECGLREGLDTVERLGDVWLATDFGWLLPILVADRGGVDEALRLADALEERPVTMGRSPRIARQLVRSLALGIRGRLEEAESAARTAVDLARGSDFLLWQTITLERLADLVELRGRRDEAVTILRQAAEVHVRKGNVVGQTRVLERLP